MKWLPLFRRSKRVAECGDEIELHIEAETDDNIARGMPPADARAAARAKFGNVTSVREEVYGMNSFGLLETMWQDLRYAWRMMRRSPVFTLAAVCTLALGIGGNTAMFTIIRSVLLKPLQYREPERLVYLSLNNPRRQANDMPFSLDRLKEMRDASQSFAAIGAFLDQPEDVTLSGTGEPESLKCARVSGNFLDILGVTPVLGRSFLPQEDMPAGVPVALISSGLWKRRFDGDPGMAGKPVTLNSISYTIVGVLPAGFEFPFPGVDVWVTKPSQWSMLAPRYWGLALLDGFGRMKPQTTIEQARAEMVVLSQQYKRAHPNLDLDLMNVVPLKDRLVQDVRTLFWILFVAVAFVLLIACANVAGLLLARSSSRTREFAVRTAVGAPRSRLVRQLVTESLVLSLAGAGLGCLLARWILGVVSNVGAINRTGPTNELYLPNSGHLQMDGTVLAATVALSLIAGLLFGLFPSLQLSKPNLVDDLRESGAAAGTVGRKRIWGVNLRALLVVGQIGLSIILLIGAGLMMRSFARLRNVDPGFQPNHVLTAKIPLPPARYDTELKRAKFFDEVVRRVDALAGVDSSAVAMSLPTTRWIRTNITKVEGRPAEEEREPPIIQSVTPGYFRTLGIPLRRGREFTAHDNQPGSLPAMIINESLARRLWPDYPRGVNPVGRHIGEGYDKTIGWFEIAGIAANVHEGGLASEAPPEFYVPCFIHPPQTAYLAVRTKSDPLSFVTAVRSQVLAVDSDQPITDVKTMNAVLDTTLGQRRLTMWLLGSFAGVALLLAVIGIYGVIAYSVAQRTQEVGIRRALGAGQGDILRMVMAQALRLSLAGVAIGVCGAFALTRVMKSLLFHVAAADPVTFVSVAALFVAIALIASYVPAQRAARLDPVSALRVG